MGSGIVQLLRLLLKEAGEAMSTRGGYRFLPSTPGSVNAKAVDELAARMPNALEPELRELRRYGTNDAYFGNVQFGIPSTDPSSYTPGGLSGRGSEYRDNPPSLFDNLFPGQMLGKEKHYKQGDVNQTLPDAYGGSYVEPYLTPHPVDKALRDQTINLTREDLLDTGNIIIDPSLVRLINNIIRANVD